MTQVADSVELQLSLFGTDQMVTDYSRAAQVIQSQTAQTSNAFKTATQSSAAFDTQSAQLTRDLAQLTGSLKTTNAAVAAGAAPATALARGLTDVDSSASHVADMFKGSLYADLVSKGLEMATSAVTEFAKGSIEAALQTERIQRTLQYASGSAEKGAESFTFVRDEAHRLGLDLATAGKEFAELAAAARGTEMEGKPVRQLFTGIAEAATVMGLSSSETAGALLAVQQMMSKGVVMSQELKLQLGNALPGAFELAAAAMGVSNHKLMEMLDKGEVIADEFLPKFGKALHDNFGEAAKNASTQGQASLNRFHTEMFELQATLGEELMPALIDTTKYIHEIITQAADTGTLKDFFEVAGIAARAAADTVHGFLISVSWIDRAVHSVAQYIASGNAGMYDMYGLTVKTAAATAQLAEEKKKVVAAAAPDNGVKVTDDPTMNDQRLTKIRTLQKELGEEQYKAIKAGADTEAAGFAAERAMENQNYARRRQEFQGHNVELELLSQIHVQKMNEIDNKEASEKDKVQNQIDDKAEAANKKLHERETQDSKEDEARTKAFYAAQDLMRNQDIEFERDGFEKRRMQAKAHFEEMRDATLKAQAEVAYTNIPLYKQYNDRLTQLDRQREAALKEINRDEDISRTQQVSASAGYLAQSLQNFKSFGKAYQQVAAAQAVIDTLSTEQGIIKSMAGAGPFGYALGVAEAITAGIAGFARVYQIEAQHFAGGGIVQGSGPVTGDHVPAWLNPGEIVMTQMQQARTLMAIANGSFSSAPRAQNSFQITYAPENHFNGGEPSRALLEWLRQDKVGFALFLKKEIIEKGLLQ